MRKLLSGAVALAATVFLAGAANAQSYHSSGYHTSGYHTTTGHNISTISPFVCSCDGSTTLDGTLSMFQLSEDGHHYTNFYQIRANSGDGDDSGGLVLNNFGNVVFKTLAFDMTNATATNCTTGGSNDGAFWVYLYGSNKNNKSINPNNQLYTCSDLESTSLNNGYTRFFLTASDVNPLVYLDQVVFVVYGTDIYNSSGIDPTNGGNGKVTIGNFTINGTGPGLFNTQVQGCPFPIYNSPNPCNSGGGGG